MPLFRNFFSSSSFHASISTIVSVRVCILFGQLKFVNPNPFGKNNPTVWIFDNEFMMWQNPMQLFFFFVFSLDGSAQVFIDLWRHLVSEKGIHPFSQGSNAIRIDELCCPCYFLHHSFVIHSHKHQLDRELPSDQYMYLYKKKLMSWVLCHNTPQDSRPKPVFFSRLPLPSLRPSSPSLPPHPPDDASMFV